MSLKIDGRMKVKRLKEDFKKEFGLNLRVYSGRSFANDDATLASIRKGENKGGEFSPRKNMKVGNLEEKFMDMFGIKVQVAGSDDSYLCENDHTLAKAVEADKMLMEKRKRRNKEVKAESLSDTSIEEIVEKIKNVYADREDLDEMVNDLENDTDYFVYWADKFVSEEYGKHTEIARDLYRLASMKATEGGALLNIASSVGREDGINDKSWARELIEKSLELAEEASDYREMGRIASFIATMLGDKDWAKSIFEKAIEHTDSPDTLSELGNRVGMVLGEEKELCEKAYNKGLEKAEEDSDQFYLKFYIANGILDCIDRERGIKIGLDVIDDERCTGSACVEVLRSILRGNVPEFEEKKDEVIEKIIDSGEAESIISAISDNYISPQDDEELFTRAVESAQELCEGPLCLCDLSSALFDIQEEDLAKEIYDKALDSAEGDIDLVNIWESVNMYGYIDDEWLEDIKTRLIEKCEDDWAKEEIAGE